MKIKLLILLSLVWLLASCGGTQRKIYKPNHKIPKRGQQVSKTRNNAPAGPHNTGNEKVSSIEELPNPVHQQAYGSTAVERYVSLYKAIAMEEMSTYGIPASITLAQGILESGAGNSSLTRRSNNHFGIKCHDWTGDRVYHDDDRRQECFRKYDNPNYSYRDHSLFLRNGARYNALFRLRVDDYKGWARGLKAAGYATDPRYPRKLINLIEEYELHQFDHQAVNQYAELEDAPEAEEVQEEQEEIEMYTVKKGDTLYNISKRFGISVEDLKRQNNLQSNDLSIGQHLDVSN